jgi:flagellar biosynthesis protein FlhA
VNTNRVSQVAIPTAVVSIVVMMVVPLPAMLLDLLIAMNISGAVLILVMSMFVRRPLELSVFPSLILVATLFRLALNVSATRLVLLNGFAGNVIESFGHFVVGGSLIVGLVLFFILVVIQFVVITKGSERVAEVAARFTLDAMPGKQMAIDADLNAGVIDDNQARIRRREVAAEADFYGAMDGASKFVKGDAIAAIIITSINLLGGFAVGVLQHHMPISEAASTYSLLSIGDGLVSQIPALLLSISTGLIVTRAATDDDMGTDVVRQFGSQRQAMRIAGAASCIIALVPGLPKLPFLLTGGGLLLLASRLPQPANPDDAPALDAGAAPPAPDSTEALLQELRVEPLQLELSFDLVDLVDASRGGDLLDRVRALRRKLALELGIVIPLVRTRDNLDLPPGTYVLRVHGVEFARGEAPVGMLLALGDDLDALPGQPTTEPVFGMPARWIPLEFAQQAELRGCTLVDRASVITTHLAELVRANASRLLSRQDVHQLLDVVKASDPAAVDDLNAAQLTLAELHAVLQQLLNERVAIRDLVRIVEAVSERARATKEVEALTETARRVLGPAISAALATNGRLPVLPLDPLLEQRFMEAVRFGDGGSFLAITPNQAESFIDETRARVHTAEQAGHQPVLVCSTQLRPALRRLLHGTVPQLPVLSYAELGTNLTVETIGVISSVDHATV